MPASDGTSELLSDDARQPPATTVTQVVSARLASMAAAFITSRFGVAGTLIGAALTSMIITGGMAVLQSHLENVPSKVKARRDQWKACHPAQPATIPGRPDLRINFMGRMRAAIDRFSHLPLRTRRSLLLKGLITAVIAFLIGIGAISTPSRTLQATPVEGVSEVRRQTNLAAGMEEAPPLGREIRNPGKREACPVAVGVITSRQLRRGP
jgi:hypothetical protein